MTNVEKVLNAFQTEFDLKRIQELTFTEKFKLVNHAKLIYSEAIWAVENGIENMNTSPKYTFNKTYNLFATLLINGISPERLKEIILNYSKNFEKSNTYYAQITLLGIGILMINAHFTPEAIYNYLLSLLGADFLMENLRYKGKPEKISELHFQVDTEIVYKPFEGQMRDLKYELLALLRIRSQNGLKYITDFINNHYEDEQLTFYFNMLHTDQVEVATELYNSLNQNLDTIQSLKLAGAYAILKNEETYSTHYLFNSIIGKYSRYDKETGEIESELQSKMKLLLKTMEG